MHALTEMHVLARSQQHFYSIVVIHPFYKNSEQLFWKIYFFLAVFNININLQNKAFVDEGPAASWCPSAGFFIKFDKTGQPGLRLSLSSIHNSVLIPLSLGNFFKKVWKFPPYQVTRVNLLGIMTWWHVDMIT